MGSIHKIDKSGTTDLDKKRITYLYYKEMLKMIEKGNFDVVGHLDYINRYYGKDYSEYNQVKEVLEAIKEHKKIIEINTSAERRVGLNLFPSIDKLTRYRLVDTSVTIGTDAHRYHELADNLEQAEMACQEFGLEPVIFQKRKKTRI